MTPDRDAVGIPRCRPCFDPTQERAGTTLVDRRLP